MPAKRFSPARLAIGVAVVILCLLTALVFCRQSRGSLHVPNRLITWVRLAELRSLDPIDAHTHISQSGPAFVGMLARLHMHVLDILYVDDTTPYRISTEPQKQDALKFIASSGGYAQLCTTFDPFRFNSADFAERAIDAVNQDFERGAIAVKVWKNVGMELKNSAGQYVMPDDPIFEPIYGDIAAHHKTLIAHLAEPDAAWTRCSLCEILCAQSPMGNVKETRCAAENSPGAGSHAGSKSGPAGGGSTSWKHGDQS